MSQVLKRKAAFALVATCIGCSDVPSPEMMPSPSVLRDSAGITIVENAVPGIDQVVPWTIAAGPEVSIGISDDERYQFVRVADARLLNDSRIAVADRGRSEIRLYDRSGAYREAWGSEGDGPGEFTGLSVLLPWPWDSLLAWDAAQRRATVYDGAGTVGRTFSFAGYEDVPRPDLAALLPDGSMLVYGSVLSPDSPLSTGLLRPPRAYARAGSDGVILGSFGVHPGNESYLEATPEFVNITTHPFARSTVARGWRDGVLVATSDRYVLDLFDPAGMLTRSIRVDYDPPPVTNEDMQRVAESRLAAADPQQRAQLRRTMEAMPPTDALPAFGDIRVDALDHLWVQTFEAPPDVPGDWVIFDPEGRVLGRFQTPGGLVVLDVGADYILGRRTGAFDVESVELWSLIRR